MGNFKNANSASATYLAAKKKLLSLGGASTSTENPTPKATPKKSKANDENSANGADGATENPTTPVSTAKKSKAKAPKSTVKTEETSDTNAAGDADNEDSTVPTVSTTITPTKKRMRAPPKPKYDENGNVITPKKRITAAQKKSAQKADEEAAAAAAAAAEKQKETEHIGGRLLKGNPNGIDNAVYEDAVGYEEILQENGKDADVKAKETADGEEDQKMTQSEQDEKLFDTSMYEKADPVETEEADHGNKDDVDLVNDEEA